VPFLQESITINGVGTVGIRETLRFAAEVLIFYFGDGFQSVSKIVVKVVPVDDFQQSLNSVIRIYMMLFLVLLLATAVSTCLCFSICIPNICIYICISPRDPGGGS
jgi:hypothetical protein